MNKHYFNITSSDEIAEIGNYPQTEIDTGQNILTESAYDLNTLFIEKGKIHLSEKSIPTNLINRAGISEGLIVDEKLKTIFEKFNLPAHKFHRIPTDQCGTTLTYYWLSIVSSSRYIDFEKSKMSIIRNSNFRTIGELTVQSIEFKNRIFNSLTFEESLKISEIILNPEFPNYDLYNFKDLLSGEFVSPRLSEVLMQEKISGIRLKENNVIQKSA